MARRVFFSFHYNGDVQRAWIVRNSWVTQDRESAGFYDSSAFEEAKDKSDSALKVFLNEELLGSSVLCVLAGAETSSRRWVRYEMLRAFVTGKGMLCVHLHELKNLDGVSSPKGANPLDELAYKTDSDGKFTLHERIGGVWQRSSDFGDVYRTSSVPYDLQANAYIKLSSLFYERAFVANDGRAHMAVWFENAARDAGR